MSVNGQRNLEQRALADLADTCATSRWVRSGGVRLHVLDYGGSPRPPLVVLPGITSPAICMDFVVRELTDLVRPVVIDVRGRGLSDGAPTHAGEDEASGRASGYDIGTYANDVAAVVEGLRLERAVLLGHSMGARIAAEVAARDLVPLWGLIAVDPPMSGPGRGAYPTTAAAFAAQLAEARRGTTADEVAHSWPRWPRRELELRARWLASCSGEAIAATHRGFESEDFFDSWPHVPAPAVLVHGADSPVVTAEGAAEAASTNPGATLMKIPDAGHMVFWDNPVASVAAVRNALVELLGE